MVVAPSSIIEPVDSNQIFDENELLRYLQAHVKDFPQPPAKLSVFKFGHGQSNPTFLLKVDLFGTTTRYVLRKKPPGILLQSAHAVEREYQVLAALGTKTNVPVPRVHCLCTDSNVIGTPFYVMEYVEGRIFLEPSLQSLNPKERLPIYQAMARALAAIHSADVDAIGLKKYGRRDNYCKRQVERWAAQYSASTGVGKPDVDPAMIRLMEWLRNNIPIEDSQIESGTGLVHGDFRIDNLVFHPVEARVIAVLDWELSTLGNQWSDVAYNCMPYNISDLRSAGSASYGFVNGIKPDGIPSQAEYLADYCAMSGRPWPGQSWTFYVGLSLFRMAAIMAGVYQRFLQGNAAGGGRASSGGAIAHTLAVTALEIIKSDMAMPSRSLKQKGTDEQHVSNRIGFSPSARVEEMKNKLVAFMEKYVYPNEEKFEELAVSDKRWTIHPLEEELKNLAKAEGLWNLWIPVDSAAKASKILYEDEASKPQGFVDRLTGAGLSNLEYGHLCEVMGRSLWAPQIFNCNAPDTGNMEVLLRYGSPEQQRVWLKPLLEGKIRSGFAMTEPQVASSDATNIACSITRHGKDYIINGRKWWTSGAMDPRCQLLIVMGKTDFKAPMHKQQSMILVDIMTPGVKILRPLTVFGYDDAPHGHAEVIFEDVRVPATNLLLGEGRGFEIAQGRLGPGRLHHCMRLVGVAERAIQMMVKRAVERKAFGKSLSEHGAFASEVAECRLDIEQARLTVLHAANQLDLYGNKIARGAIAMAKVAAPRTALRVLDSAIQVHGGGGVCSDFVLAHLWAAARTLRIADGPDEVHVGTIAKLEIAKSRL
ncbi:hypothetical protein O6H91_18G017300 [Diphasiastrum complanatum]|uniref:Uncharacterized protein n=1 Tax=Diphasiastrum complanatum TaxID=34168 RepID=A0ACC2AYF1_DIPCM|nr:hypothetical protein O6H91_18G017300 [Diphasiastrum complanatum]